MAKDKSTQIRDFVKNSLAAYYKNFLVKLDTPDASDVNAAIKIGNKKYQGGGEVYVWGLGGYGEGGYDIDNASTLLDIIHDLSNNKITNINAEANIKVEKNGVDISISALGYTYNLEKDSFVELNSNIATGTNSHAEGYHTTATNEAEHAEGKYNQSHENQTIHSIGIGTTNTNRRNAFEVMQDGSIYVYGLGNYDGSTLMNASTLQQVIENTGGSELTYYAGDNIEITPDNSINALGYVYNKDTSSFAEGYENVASGSYSHAEGNHTKTLNNAEHAEGKYNQSHERRTIHSIGIGGGEQTRKNAFEVIQDGSIYVYGLGGYDGSTLRDALTLLEVIKNAGSGQTYYAGLNIEITQNNSINALGYTYGGNANVSTFIVNAKKTNNYIYDLFAINSNNDRVLTVSLDDSVLHITTYSLNVARNFLISVKTDGQALGNTDITNDNSGDLRLLTYDGNIKLITNGGDIVLDTTPTDNTIQLAGETICNNNITAVAFYQSSDERLKNIKSELSTEDCYKLITDCSTIIYSLKTDEKDQNQIGMIAQLVKEIMPEIVQESNGYYSINYSRLSVVALNLIKDLNERIIELEKDHNKLEELIKRVEKLEK